ncbi:hypothetical protein [Mycolicibacterium fortuitum]
MPHTVHNLSDAPVELIWIVSPPTDWPT